MSQPKQLSDQLTVERLPNGYWQATITLPWPEHLRGNGQPYVQRNSLCHDEEEARDWGVWMIGWLTDASDDNEPKEDR